MEMKTSEIKKMEGQKSKLKSQSYNAKLKTETKDTKCGK